MGEKPHCRLSTNCPRQDLTSRICTHSLRSDPSFQALLRRMNVSETAPDPCLFQIFKPLAAWTRSSVDQLVRAAIAGVKDAESYDTTGNYNQFWLVERYFNNRTSLVIDPPDGRIPALTPAGAASAAGEGGLPGGSPRRRPRRSTPGRTLCELRCAKAGGER